MEEESDPQDPKTEPPQCVRISVRDLFPSIWERMRGPADDHLAVDVTVAFLVCAKSIIRNDPIVFVPIVIAHLQSPEDEDLTVIDHLTILGRGRYILRQTSRLSVWLVHT